MDVASSFVFIAVVLTLIPLINYAHQPVLKLSKNKQNNIKENGLIHFTSVSSAEQILREQQITGHISHGSKDEANFGPSIWFYPHKGDNIDSSRKKLICTKKYKENPHCYSACLLITNLDKNDFTPFRGRLQDDALIYIGSSITGDIKLIKVWNE